MEKTFVLGIDLGTSNSAMAWAEAGAKEAPVILEIPQTLGVNSLGTRSTFPSATYLPNESEFGDNLAHPHWEEKAGVIRGEFAREHGAMVPDRLITSAKSWLSNPHVDPASPVLPWQSEIPDDEKSSAFDVSRGYLEHLRLSYETSENSEELNQGEIVVTVPASFDEVARNLTLDAADAAGLGEVVLLEEPLAAFYAWTTQTGSDWRKQVQNGDIILVCDVGGGTADFSLLLISEEGGNLEIERISVGEHLLLGGDNMDLALAYTLQAELAADGTRIDSWQMLSLVQGCRAAKETLFSRDDLDEAPISVPSRGSSLLAKTLSTRLKRETLEAVVLDGFFPLTGADELPIEQARSGFQEFGLPYASDPVVSKHLARFLTRSRENVGASEELSSVIEVGSGGLLHPTAVLFNGGAFKAASVRSRVIELLAGWNGGNAPRELEGFEPDLAVARGAAVYARNRASGKGLRIKAGTSRSYYLGMESSMPAIPGFKPPMKGVCVVPQGMEEGSEHTLEGQEFGLITGQEAEFRFFSSEVRSGDEPGFIVENADQELEDSAQLPVELPPLEGHELGEMIPVKLQAVVTELGHLELWMQHTGSDQKWQLTFKVRTE
jgi:molecular chaperone DnaK (HSP70)